jgi:hypothetical protein
MGAKIEMKGLQELRDELRRLPADLTDEATHIVQTHAESAKQEIEAAYPTWTGHLKAGLTISRVQATFTTAAILRNRAKHAYIYEHGSEMRHTDSGAARGRMPPGHVFLPISGRWRALMIWDLIRLVRRAVEPAGHVDTAAAA